ncbi:MAG: DUF21 domain-containing protein [Planctomycetes bacterium]|nr:DUF21 domain-containing protein [Planctomycetota bacterium]
MLLQILYLLGALLFVFLNGFFVLAEFAIVKVRATRIRELARSGDLTAERALAIQSKMDAYLAACQLGITIASLALGWIGEPAFARLLQPLLDLPGIWPKVVSHSVAVAMSFVLITFLHIVLGELIPKSYAIRRAERAALFSAKPLFIFFLLFFPALWILNAMSNLAMRIMGIPPASETEAGHTEEELRMILGASHERGQFTLSRLLMMENLLDFGTLTVEDVMIPASKAVTLDAAAPWPENFERIRKCMHSRYPLRRPDRTRIDTEVHVKDITVALGKAPDPPDLVKLARPIAVVRPDLTLENLITHFHQMGTHMAVVEDTHGKWIGIVTLEDVLEELIGTIRDEFEPVKEERLIDLVPEAAIDTGLRAATKAEAVRRLCEILAGAVPGVGVEPLVQAILKREDLASTGLGEGVAIPHARLPGLARPVAAFARSEGVEFASLDGKPAQLLFLIATPPHDEGAHVRVLAKISRLLSSDYLKERLLQAGTAAEVREIFDVSDKSVPA